ncbi:ORF945 [White spot syndrome virus]|uniref:Wsv371 n=4 Tax=White spot syndrome virus TaxID=342409 RepID=Q8VAN0_WSSVS|nr:wsv371 [Shrimp white spot syndrome virus]AAL33373.1 wsv371 [Shrimp white spot syndrome virus]AAL89298.1 WSSV430 [Shrimp white spot syndrome virus]AFX59748.1 wsv371 [White spot syndrome virus]ATU83941.1 ORF945 [White spot syndrome virus]
MVLRLAFVFERTADVSSILSNSDVEILAKVEPLRDENELIPLDLEMSITIVLIELRISLALTTIASEEDGKFL